MSVPQDPFFDDLDDSDVGALEEALSQLPPVAPDPNLRQALLEASARSHRFEELVAPFARTADIDEATVERLLLAIDEPAQWSQGPAPWIHLLHFEGGPRTARCITGIVKIDPGLRFPHHGHLGEEIALVLQGEAQSGGRTYERGDIMISGPAEEHDVVATSDIPLLYLAVVAEGIRIGDDVFTFDDPRA